MIHKSYLIEENLSLLKSNIVLFYGENIGLLEYFKRKIIEENSKKKIVRYTQEEIITDKSKIFEEVYNVSLFQDKKIFIITNITDKTFNTIEEISTKIDNNNLYLFSESLEKRSKLRNLFENRKNFDLVPCYKDDSNNIKKLIRKDLRDFSNITPEIINIIAETCSNDRVRLNNEITKIKSFFKGKNVILNSLIKLLSLPEHEDFNLIRDTALNGDKKQTGSLLNSCFIENEKISFYLSIINFRLNKLKKVVDHNQKNINESIERIKPPIFWKDKPNFIHQANKWNSRKILKALNETYSAEVNLKSKSYLEKKIILKKLIIDICELANAA